MRFNVQRFHILFHHIDSISLFTTASTSSSTTDLTSLSTTKLHLCSLHILNDLAHHADSTAFFSAQIESSCSPHNHCPCSAERVIVLVHHSLNILDHHIQCPCSPYIMSLFTHIESMSLVIHIFNIRVRHTQSMSPFTTQSQSPCSPQSMSLFIHTVNVTVHHTESLSLFTIYVLVHPHRVNVLVHPYIQYLCSPHTVRVFVHYTVNVLVHHIQSMSLFTQSMSLFTTQSQSPCSPHTVNVLVHPHSQCHCSPHRISVLVHHIVNVLVHPHSQCHCSPHRISVLVHHIQSTSLFTTHSVLVHHIESMSLFATE